MADRSTAAVGVANESGEGPLAAQEGGATADGKATDDQTSSGVTADTPTKEQPTATTAEAAPTQPLDTVAAAAADEPADPDAQDGCPPEPAEQPTEPMAVAAAESLAESTAESPAESAVHVTAESSAVAAGAADGTTGTAGDAAREKGSGKAAGEVPATAAKGADDADDADNAAAPVTDTRPTTRLGTAKPAAAPAPARELHSGHKLARRYQLEECVTRVDGFSSWRAVDEKLRRAVGVHVLPAGHPRARHVLSAARSAALLGDPRFVQVLDAVEENDLVYVIHEWLPDATSLADLLAVGPLEPHEAYQMVSQVSQGMSAAHREGLAHLRLDPGAVLRTTSGQYRIRGLAVASALRGLSSERPQRQDTEAIGALLYACLTQRWPYEEDAHGLVGLPKGVGLVAPDQVRAGIHRGLSEIAMRALVNDGATASREEPPCTTPEELAKAVAAMPRIRPPEQPVPVYQPPVFHQPPAPPRGATRTPAPAQMPPPALPGRTGKALKWAVSALVIVAIGLGSWQLADALKSRGTHTATPSPTGQKGGQDPTQAPAPKPITIAGVQDFDPMGDDRTENPSLVPKAHDGDPSTFWQTSHYTSSAFGNLKPGVGLIVDLGKPRNVSTVKVDFVGDTPVQLMAAPAGATTAPSDLSSYTKVAQGSGSDVTLKPSGKLTSQFVLVWLTGLPQQSDGQYRGEISEIHVTG